MYPSCVITHFWLLTVLQVDRITGVLLDISELKTSRHSPFLFAWMDTSNGVNVGSDDGMNVGLVEDDGEFDGWDDGKNDGWEEVLGLAEGSSDNDGLLDGEDEGKFDGWIDSEGDVVGHVLPKILDVSLDPKSPPSITTLPSYEIL